MLNRYIQICLLLKTKILEPSLVLNIIKIMKITEKKEILDYHTERWETISGKYFKSMENSSFTNAENNYSYVLNGEIYIYEKDRTLDYYKETGISFQSRRLLLNTLKNEALEWSDGPDVVDNLNKESNKWRKYNDKIYGILSLKIMKCMREE